MTIMERTIDVGVMWHADFVNFINTLGLPGTLALIALLGFLAGRLERGRCSVWSGMAGYFLLLQMLAFPVGNFVLASVFLCFTVGDRFLTGAALGIELEAAQQGGEDQGGGQQLLLVQFLFHHLN